MVEKLRRKFIAIALSAVAVLLSVSFGVINGINWNRLCSESDWVLQIILRQKGNLERAPETVPALPEWAQRPDFPGNGTELPDGHQEFWDELPPERVEGLPLPAWSFELTPERQDQSRYFLVWLDEQGQPERIDLNRSTAVSEEQAGEYARQAAEQGQKNGFLAEHRFLTVDRTGGGRVVLFLNCAAQLQVARVLAWTSVGVTCGGLFLVYLAVALFSRRAIRPLAETMEKQKRFITDAGHELKTPLSTILASADVLELEIGPDNQWLRSIRHQAGRMSRLIQDLLTLSKLAEEQQIRAVPFSLSEAVAEAAEPFEMMAEACGKRLNCRIEPELSMLGDRSRVTQLVELLLDNGVKYASDGGTVALRLERKGRSLVQLTVSNPCDELPEGDLERLFDRFYRADSSRSRSTGGYGVGLSIARSIAETHRGRIQASREDGRMVFTVTLPVGGTTVKN